MLYNKWNNSFKKKYICHGHKSFPSQSYPAVGKLSLERHNVYERERQIDRRRETEKDTERDGGGGESIQMVYCIYTNTRNERERVSNRERERAGEREKLTQN